MEKLEGSVPAPLQNWIEITSIVFGHIHITTFSFLKCITVATFTTTDLQYVRWPRTPTHCCLDSICWMKKCNLWILKWIQPFSSLLRDTAKLLESCDAVQVGCTAPQPYTCWRTYLSTFSFCRRIKVNGFADSEILCLTARAAIFSHKVLFLKKTSLYTVDAKNLHISLAPFETTQQTAGTAATPFAAHANEAPAFLQLYFGTSGFSYTPRPNYNK